MGFLSGLFSIDTLISWLQRFIVLFTAITVHEYAHGFVAYKLGDPTAKRAGRLTLNPLSHLDPIGAICMVLVGFGWAKPVPINPFYFRNRKRDTAIVSLAGPAANIVLAFLSTIIYVPFYAFAVVPSISAKYGSAAAAFAVKQYGVTAIYGGLGIIGFIAETLITLAVVNISFAVFNLIPFPPLDGSKILGAVLPNNAYMTLLRYERIGFPILIILSITGILGRILGFVIDPIISLWGAFGNIFLDILLKFTGVV